MYDVIIVGAGPAGNITASKLASLGYRVAVLDQRHEIGDKLCTGIIGVECARKFPPKPSIIRHKAFAATIISPAGKRYIIDRDDPQAFVIDRVAYVKSLADTAIMSGAKFLLGHRVINLDTKTDHVKIVTNSESGQHIYRTEMLVISSGFGTPLLKMAGLSSSNGHAHMMGIQAEVEAPDLKHTEVHLGNNIAPGSFGWMVPISESRALVGTVSSNRPNGEIDQFLSSLQRMGKVNNLLRPIRRWGIPVKPISKTYCDRILVTGDAAGFAKPTTGGGIYYALLSGEMAANTIHSALIKNDFTAKQLKPYQLEWQKLFGKELNTGYYARILFESLKDIHIEHLLHLCFKAQEDLINTQEFSFDWHSKTIIKALGRNDLTALFRSIGPMILPVLSRLIHVRS